MRWPWRKKEKEEDPKFLMENNPYISSHQRMVHRKIREAEERGEAKRPKRGWGGEKPWGCVECYGWGYLVETWREGLLFWMTCDFCGHVEPFEEVAEILKPVVADIGHRAFLQVHRTENLKCLEKCTCGLNLDYEILKYPSTAFLDLSTKLFPTEKKS